LRQVGDPTPPPARENDGGQGSATVLGVKLTCRRLQRGVFHSLVDLQAAINRYLAEHNHSLKPFTWTADPDRIIAAANRGTKC
jgi:hypothetical protein